MSFIQIDKKAVTKEGVHKVLDQSYSLTMPFGIPTVYLRPEEFIPSDNNPLFNMQQRIKMTVRDLIKNGHLGQDEFLEENVLRESWEKQAEELLVTHKNPNRFFVGAFTGNILSLPSHHYNPQDYQEPWINIVLAPKAHMTGKNFCSFALKIESLPMPGLSTQWQFKSLWHEIGHGTGAAEPQAEAISAVMCRKAFADNCLLMAEGDIRALGTVLDYYKKGKDGTYYSEEYGWPMVEVQDYIRSLPESITEALTEKQIKNIRFQKFDHLRETVHEVGEMIQRSAPKAFARKDYTNLAKTAESLKIKNGMNDKTYQILTRFQLACERFTHGVLAYEDGNDIIKPEFLESERQKPLTFVPEYIPE